MIKNLLSKTLLITAIIILGILTFLYAVKIFAGPNEFLLELFQPRLVNSILVGVGVSTVIVTMRELTLSDVKLTNEKETYKKFSDKQKARHSKDEKFSELEDWKIVGIGFISLIIYNVILTCILKSYESKDELSNGAY